MNRLEVRIFPGEPQLNIDVKLYAIINSMKECSSCKQNLTLDNFNKKRDKLQPYCRVCDNAKSRERYANNREHHISVIRKRNDAYLEELRSWTRKLKESNPCVDCNVSYPWYVLDFDHVSGTKVDNISNMIAKRSAKQKILDEIDKCEIVCSNCHRQRTYNRSINN